MIVPLRACLRSSPLTKRYGWGIHFNHEEKIALYGKDSDAYKQLRALEREGILSLQKLATFSKKELLKLHGMRPSTIPKLRKARDCPLK